MTQLRTCNACGWVAFGVTRESAVTSVMRFNDYFNRLSLEQQQAYYNGKGASLDSYMRCFRCGGNYTNFRDSKEGDCPYGVTLQPILLVEKK